VSAFPGHLQALLSPRAYPHPVSRVQLVETHISWVLLTGEFAYKIKRPVHYAFVDQRSAERRRALCQEELRLNRRFAPELYLADCAVTSTAGEAHIEGSGAVIEHAVRMRQFAPANELDRLLETGTVAPDDLECFGRALADIHSHLPVARPGQGWGEPAALGALVFRNLEESAAAGRVLGAAADLQPLQSAITKQLQCTSQLRSQRLADGRVRECHGDLHARNIVRYGGRLIAFDCLEFDPALRWIDVAEEVALLLADLTARDRRPHAQAFLGGCLTASGDYQACALQPLFQAHLALVRAKIVALSAGTAAGEADRSVARGLYARYVEVARSALTPQPPSLVLMCGLSGSGKTWLAQRLTTALGAVHVRSDIERKRMAGLPAAGQSHSPVGAGLYSREASLAVYNRLAACATDALRGGYTTVVDATFALAADRSLIRELAARHARTACIVYCRAPREVLQARISQRQQRLDDPSEAGLAVLAWQEAHFEPPQPHEGLPVLELQGPEPVAIDALAARIISLVE
jgi:aminoglycoside phosphotransferase family enzyme/predicted kinase